ncbi:MAG: hypothetical protein EKK53_10520 [Burkholderiales bacterium]|nr:MAG: hypothetical protein EKK53_10520 [Burkholderiales bacterium]
MRRKFRPTYRLHHRDAARDPNRFLLAYAWTDLDNTAWRPCVEHFVAAVEALGHPVVAMPAPAFEPGEDFVPIEYRIAGVRTTFSSDLLLSLIEIWTEDPHVLQSVWDRIGSDVGWVARPTAPPADAAPTALLARGLAGASAWWRRWRSP